MSAQEETFTGWPIDGHCATTPLQNARDFVSRAIAWLQTSRNLQATAFGEGLLEGQLMAYRDVLSRLDEQLRHELEHLVLDVLPEVPDAG